MENSEVLEKVLHKIDRVLDQCLNNIPEAIDIRRYQAFTWHGKSRQLKPIKRPVQINADDLIGIDQNKKRLFKNTASFVEGRRANNVLLWGERGTGKSSLVKSIVKLFGDRSLKVIQVYKQDILTIQEMYDFFWENRDCKFIVFIDDLSFEETQTDYKELKSIMDGGLEEIPENILFYATSNRKHLIPTRFSDRDDDVVRPSDTLEEKISLADRFGIKLGFYHISQDTYLDIVDLYAKKYGIAVAKRRLHRLALQWTLEAGGRNGRIAEQFVRSMQGVQERTAGGSL